MGYALTTDLGKPVIGFDMGGTSTDVSRYGGDWEHTHESETAGVRIQAPQLDIRTVAAGGGSRLFFRQGRFEVGPESAGAHPVLSVIASRDTWRLRTLILYWAGSTRITFHRSLVPMKTNRLIWLEHELRYNP